jgi:hypothetical protein
MPVANIGMPVANSNITVYAVSDTFHLLNLGKSLYKVK